MVLPSPNSLTPAWLTAALKSGGHLQNGQVTHIEWDKQTFNQGLLADVMRLTVQYSADAAGSLPQKLILKMPKANLHAELLHRSAHEVKFYQAAEQAGMDLPLPMIYDASYDEEDHRSHILMQDLSGTHFQKPLPIPPSNRHCFGIMESAARLHALWWNSPQLGSQIGERMTSERYEAIEKRLAASLPALLDHLGDALLPFQRGVLEAIVQSSFLQRLGRRLCDLRGVTLIHGDMHTANLMLPRAEDEGQRVIFIDWQLWDINVAAVDLAFMIALHWDAERRAALELPLLRHYHNTLLAQGVAGYDFEDLWRDYRESVMVMCLVPIGQYRRGSPAGVVWYGLQHSLAAYRDLNCAELLD